MWSGNAYQSGAISGIPPVRLSLADLCLQALLILFGFPQPSLTEIPAHAGFFVRQLANRFKGPPNNGFVDRCHVTLP